MTGMVTVAIYFICIIILFQLSLNEGRSASTQSFEQHWRTQISKQFRKLSFLNQKENNDYKIQIDMSKSYRCKPIQPQFIQKTFRISTARGRYVPRPKNKQLLALVYLCKCLLQPEVLHLHSERAQGFLNKIVMLCYNRCVLFISHRHILGARSIRSKRKQLSRYLTSLAKIDRKVDRSQHQYASEIRDIISKSYNIFQVNTKEDLCFFNQIIKRLDCLISLHPEQITIRENQIMIKQSSLSRYWHSFFKNVSADQRHSLWVKVQILASQLKQRLFNYDDITIMRSLINTIRSDLETHPEQTSGKMKLFLKESIVQALQGLEELRVELMRAVR